MGDVDDARRWRAHTALSAPLSTHVATPDGAVASTGFGVPKAMKSGPRPGMGPDHRIDVRWQQPLERLAKRGVTLCKPLLLMLRESLRARSR